jgi:hypothetical protein
MDGMDGMDGFVWRSELSFMKSRSYALTYLLPCALLLDHRQSICRSLTGKFSPRRDSQFGIDEIDWSATS